MKNHIKLETSKTNFSFEKKFYEYMYYVSTADIDDIKNCMKRNLLNVKTYNINNYEKLIYYYNNFNYWGKIDPTQNVFELIDNRALMLKENFESFLWLYDKLNDYRSKKTLFSIIDNWLTFSMISLDSIIEKTFCHYFDLDIIKCEKDEVFVDLGSYIGDTVNDYIVSYTDYKKIYCYEIVNSIFDKLTDNMKNYPNIELRQKGVSDKSGIMYISDKEPNETMHKLSSIGTNVVEVVSLDEDIKEPISFIKMDIEGGEQKALLGCKKHILASHPKLAISVYHNNEDIWKCARIIDEIDPNYNFYLRYNGGNYYPSEYVLLCVHSNY